MGLSEGGSGDRSRPPSCLGTCMNQPGLVAQEPSVLGLLLVPVSDPQAPTESGSPGHSSLTSVPPRRGEGGWGARGHSCLAPSVGRWASRDCAVCWSCECVREIQESALLCEWCVCRCVLRDGIGSHLYL